MTPQQRSELAARMTVAAARHNARHRQLMAMLTSLNSIDWPEFDALKAEQDADWLEIDSLQATLTHDAQLRIVR